MNKYTQLEFLRINRKKLQNKHFHGNVRQDKPNERKNWFKKT